MKKSSVVFLSAAMVALTLTACAGPQPAETSEPTDSGSAVDVDALYEAAQQEGTVIWYSSTNENGFLDDFRAEYPGVDIQFLKLSSDELSTRFAQEQDSGAPTADFIVNSSPEFLEDGNDQGWFADISDLPAAADYPAEYFEGTSALIATSPIGIAYNTDLVDESDAPESWEDVLDPQFTEIAMADIRQSATYRATAYIWEQEYGIEFLEELSERNLQVAAGGLPGLQATASGAAQLTLSGSETFVQGLAADGAPLEFVLPTPFTGAAFRGMVVEGAEHPNAARLVMNFLMSEAGQEHFAAYMASPLGTFGTTITIPEGFLQLDPVTVLAAEPELVEALGLN